MKKRQKHMCQNWNEMRVIGASQCQDKCWHKSQENFVGHFARCWQVIHEDIYLIAKHDSFVGLACTSFCFTTQDIVLENENNYSMSKKKSKLYQRKNYNDLKKIIK
jgi:hypothetical protein